MVANAALELHNARGALNDLLTPKTEVIANAESALADAELEAQTAQETLDDLLTPKPEVIAAAEDTVAQARVALRDAELALDNDLATAIDNMQIAERDLAVARLNLDALNDSNQLKSTKDTYDQEHRDYANIIYKWTGVHATDEDLALTPDDLFAALNFAPELVYDRNYPLFPEGRIADNPDTRWKRAESLWLACAVSEKQPNRGRMRPLHLQPNQAVRRKQCQQRFLHPTRYAERLRRSGIGAQRPVIYASGIQRQPGGGGRGVHAGGEGARRRARDP